ncbi:hypothetical protein [Cohnella yongneupensis]|uniref:Uncharacterized protein n=1 Tax=Cohnella yongneupensis TaxID=425006 RepID=A0ABW0QYY8_9BACL
MITVRDARYCRVLDRGGHRLAEVEVYTGHPRDPQLVAYFSVDSNGAFKLENVLTNDADAEIDWFDNNMHSAMYDVSPQIFSGPDHLGLFDRKDFAAQLLAREGVKEALERNLKREAD